MTCLQQIKSAILDHSTTKLKRLLSKDMDNTFDSSQKIVLEIFLSHKNSPLFVNSTPEVCYKLIYELKSCLGLTDDETIEGSWVLYFFTLKLIFYKIPNKKSIDSSGNEIS